MSGFRTKPIQVFGCSTGQEEADATRQVLESQWLGMGPRVIEFEEKFKRHGRLQNFLMVDSGSNALWLAIALLNLPPKSEIVLPSLTWIACANVIKLAGHTPIFCDVELDTCNVSSSTLQRCLTQNTAAIMIVHFAGLPVELEPILKLGYPLIEDAAHAADSWYNGALCGSLGDIGIYSFNSVKNIASGGGGGITVRSELLFERAQRLRYCGIGESGYDASVRSKFPWWQYDISESFIKMLPNDLNASVATVQLGNLLHNQKRRREIWNRYNECLSDLSWLSLPSDAPGRERDLLAKYLFERGIYTTVRYSPLHHLPIFGHQGNELVNTDKIYKQSLCLPLHPGLTEEDLSYVIDSIKAFGRIAQ